MAEEVVEGGGSGVENEGAVEGLVFFLFVSPLATFLFLSPVFVFLSSAGAPSSRV